MMYFTFTSVLIYNDLVCWARGIRLHLHTQGMASQDSQRSSSPPAQCLCPHQPNLIGSSTRRHTSDTSRDSLQSPLPLASGTKHSQVKFVLKFLMMKVDRITKAGSGACLPKLNELLTKPWNILSVSQFQSLVFQTTLLHNWCFQSY